MKTTLTVLSGAALSFSTWAMPQAVAMPAATNMESKRIMLPIRRLGLLPVANNVVDARLRLSDETSLRGILAQPLSAEAILELLNATLKKASDASGRFWTMDALSTDFAIGRANAQKLSSSQQAQWVKDYDLDGWLAAELYFSADHTTVRLSLSGQQGRPLIAREDLTLPYGVDLDTLKNAFTVAIGRMAETIGHDGRIVFENDDLVGLDFGIERGLAVGQRLKAGLVVQSAAHPQTGEVLRYKRQALLELEVIEPRQGAALCKKISVNPEQLKQFESVYGSGSQKRMQLLVWRESQTGGATLTASELSSPDEGIHTKASSASSGFKSQDVQQSKEKSVKKLAKESQSAGPSAVKKESQAQAQAQDTRPAEPSASSAEEPVASDAKTEAKTFFSTIKFGAGSTLGSLALSKGPVDAELPAYLLNTFSLQDGFRYDQEWNIKYGAEYLMIGGKLDGSRFTFKGAGFAPASLLQIPEVPIQWGAEAQYSTGTATTGKSKKTFDAFEVFGVLATERMLQGGWGLGVDYKQSMTGLLAGLFGFEAGLEVYSAAPLPKELGFQWRYINDGDRWTELLLGVTWKLGAVEK
jgi:hypothetical protein